MTFRAVATAAISAALAGTTLAVVSPATAAPSDQLGCQYPANFVTITVLDLSRSTVQYGARVTVRVNVNAVGTNRDPDGSVVVRVAGDSGSDQLNNSGIAHVKLPRLETGNYTVSARYNPEKCSRFQVSSDTRSLRVVKAGSKTKVNVGNVERGDHPKARVEVETSTGVTARGDVRVHISKGRKDHTKSIDLNGGDGSVQFPEVRDLGEWDVKATYGGTKNIADDTDRDTFKVTRN
jgi:hypothetical protein